MFFGIILVKFLILFFSVGFCYWGCENVQNYWLLEIIFQSSRGISIIFISQCVYWVMGIVLFSYDYYNERTNQLSKRRISYIGRRNLDKIDYSFVILALKTVLFNSIVTIIASATIYRPIFYYFKESPQWFENDNISNYLLIIIKIPLLIILTDAIFYILHRMFHENKWLYTNIHKHHHTWVDTYSVAALAAHPIEHVVVNLSTAYLPCFMLQLPYQFFFLWIIVATWNTCWSHSGYVILPKFKGIPHDYHHHFQNVEYGSGGYMDKFFKTRLEDKYPDKCQNIVY